jgi:hypothetical protein
MLALIKILTSAVLIYLVNEIVVRHSKPLLGSLIASLPLVSLLTFFWIWFDLRSRPEEFAPKLASHSTGVFWFVIPSLPMFLLIPWMLKKGIGFWPSMAAGCLLTMILYFITAKALSKFGIAL